MIDYPELADFLLVAEAILQTPAKKIAEEANLHLADSALHAPAAQFAGQDFYPAFATKAAVLCAHLVKNHPLKDGNVQVALVATIEFCGRHDFIWSLPPGEDHRLGADRTGRGGAQRRHHREPGSVDRRSHRRVRARSSAGLTATSLNWPSTSASRAYSTSALIRSRVVRIPSRFVLPRDQPNTAQYRRSGRVLARVKDSVTSVPSPLASN